jgi:transposase
MLLRQLGLSELLEALMPSGREEIPWSAMTVVRGRLPDPSSELHLAEHGYEASALAELLGVPAAKVNDDRLYRTLDRLPPHKPAFHPTDEDLSVGTPALEKHLKQRMGELFNLDYDLLLYDVTSTYFEGAAAANPQAQRGYSRDRRPDCRQVNIALVVSRSGLPLGYEVFAGNRSDVTTVKEIVKAMESKYGQANRIWVMDRGMVSAGNVEFLQQGGRRYILGTPKSRVPSDRSSSLGWKSMLRKFEQQLLASDWREAHEGLEVKLCPAPGGEEVFILCRSAQRQLKEQAMHDGFERRIEQKLEAMAEGCGKRKQDPLKVAQQVGRLLGKNSRAAGLFQVEVEADTKGWAHLRWTKRDERRDWMKLSEGCYLPRSPPRRMTDWSGEELWRAFIQLTEAEEAFRLHKSDLVMRPVWRQKEHRVQAHILACFLAYVLWKTLGLRRQRAGLGDEPRKIFAELQQISLVDVALPTRAGVSIRKRCVSRPTDNQAILLQRLGLQIPTHIEFADL